MHLRSIAIKGFKSFPHRTKLDFTPGVSVVVGPNGSGKSNITDAVLWALGEQSPLAVRGQTMKDVIFAGGHGVKGSSAAEVEVVIDNQHAREHRAPDGEAASGSQTQFSEISIVRRLDRSGDGEYRLNGARCRLADVVEVLSDTGLGKEMHSVVSQGRVESIVLSRPRERRLLIEEAAGLGKHRKRRRRAQLKLERTGENLSRALDVEREARSRLRPLKRQAEAAQLHERLERQADEARYELARDAARDGRERLAAAEDAAAGARRERDDAERLLTEVGERRRAAEGAFATIAGRREELQGRLYAARSAHERIGMRLERARDQARAAGEGGERRRHQLELLDAELAQAGDPAAGAAAERIEALEAELALIEGAREQRAREAVAALRAEREQQEVVRARLEAAASACREAHEAADAGTDAARASRRDAERAAEAARRAAAAAGAELATLNQYLRTASPAPTGGVPPLSEQLTVDAGFEAAVAAVLGARLGAGVVESLAAGERALGLGGEDGGLLLLADAQTAAATAAGAPSPDAVPLADHARAGGPAGAVAARLLAGVWVVGALTEVDAAFTGVAVTRTGRVLDRQAHELRQAPGGGPERLLEQRNRRAGLVSASEQAVRAEASARAEVDAAGDRLRGAEATREEAEADLRRALREGEEAAEAVRRSDWLIERRMQAPDDGPDAVRRAELTAEVRAERTMADAARREHAERQQRRQVLAARIERDSALAGLASRASHALAAAQDAVGARASALDAERAAGAEEGEQAAAALRDCSHEEAGLQARLREASERVTGVEVAAQQARDTTADALAVLDEVAARLGLEVEPAAEPLTSERRGELEQRIERLARRREQLGPVNPLAASEYEEAIAHVEELEARRADLEGALAELEGLIRETDRRIRESFEETFEATAGYFEDVCAHLFPGGRGRLRLVRPDQGPRPTLGGEPASTGEDASAEASDAPDPGAPDADAEPGVEIEVTPAGKSTKRLSLMSGGEKSLVALAFMFAVFLAKPCPFYILDEVEAALDDVNIDRFLQLVRRYSDRAQFIVVTHQKRTMDAADRIYGVSMGGDGISRVVSRRLGGQPGEGVRAGEAA
jgi:chromosome segregation protein